MWFYVPNVIFEHISCTCHTQQSIQQENYLAVLSGVRLGMQGLDWAFAVISSPQMNAFVMPGGKVVVYTGLMNILKSEDELAAVLAHEVAHVLARHVVRLTHVLQPQTQHSQHGPHAGVMYTCP